MKGSFFRYKFLFIIFLFTVTSSVCSQSSGEYLNSIYFQAASSSYTSSQTAFNPMISVIGDLLLFESDRKSAEFDNGLDIREIEIAFSSSVDVYARADFFFAIHREKPLNLEEASDQDQETVGSAQHYEIELEEGYLTFLTLPANFQIKIGKFRSSIGKINTKHLHTLNFHDYPLVLMEYFGDDGLIGTGAEINLLLPFNFYSELKYQIQRDESGAYFATSGKDEWYHAFHLKNFFELHEDHSLEIGFSLLFNPSRIKSTRIHPTNQTEEEDINTETESEFVDITHTVAAANIYYVWRPSIQAREKKLMIDAEFFYFSSNLPELEDTYSFFGEANYQFSQRWAAGIRYDYIQKPYLPDATENSYTACLTYIQSEYAFIRSGYTCLDDNGEKENIFFAQLNFGIGPHRAHEF